MGAVLKMAMLSTKKTWKGEQLNEVGPPHMLEVMVDM